MGSAMARNLLKAGLRTYVWDRSPTATAPLAEGGDVIKFVQKTDKTLGFSRT
jgi:3-hydroxyisobutyrate dehydrogenase-like beta-hydroxyacid dehydrogenase